MLDRDDRLVGGVRPAAPPGDAEPGAHEPGDAEPGVHEPGDAEPGAHEEFLRVLRDHLPALGPADELDPACPLRDLGLTSLRAVNLLIDIEDGLSVAFPDEELNEENFATAASLWAVVARLRAGEGS